MTERYISFEDAVKTVVDAAKWQENYIKTLERRLANLVNGEGELTSVEVVDSHCPQRQHRTLVRVPLIDDGSYREGPGEVEPRIDLGHRYVCRYYQTAGITIGSCGWIGWVSDLEPKKVTA